MARTLATNYTGTLQFPYATAGTDLFKKEDVQTLALAVDQHDHSPGKGLLVAGNGLQWPLVAPNSATIDGPVGTPNTIVVNGTVRVQSGGLYVTTAGQGVWLHEPNANVDTLAIVCNGGYFDNRLLNDSYPWRILNKAGGTQLFLVDSAGNTTVAGYVQSPTFQVDAPAYKITTYPNCFTIMSPGYSQITAPAATFMYSNGYFDGTNSVRINTANPTVLLQVASSGLSVLYVAAGGNPITWGSTLVSLDTAGNMNVNGILKCIGANIQLPDANNFIGSGGGICYLRFQSQIYCQNFNGSAWIPVNASAFTVQSAARGKRNIVPMQDPLAIVLNDELQGVTYTDTYSGKSSVGFVADPWRPVVPEVVKVDERGEVMALDYDRIGAITFQALKQYVQKTESRLAALEGRTV